MPNLSRAIRNSLIAAIAVVSMVSVAPAQDAAISAYLAAKYPAAMERVVVSDKEIRIIGRVPREQGSFVLAALPLWQPIMSWSEPSLSIPLADVSENGRFEHVVTREAFPAELNLLAHSVRWAVMQQQGESYKLASHVRYPDDALHANPRPQEKPRHRKGIGALWVGRPWEDLDDLDIAAATVNIVLSGLVRTTPSPRATSFDFAGETWHVDAGYLQTLDRTLAEAAKRKIIVSAIILIPLGHQAPEGSYARRIAHPDAKDGHYAMPNMNSADGVRAYAAALHFLAQRYRPGSEYGRIHHWIMHNEVDAGWEWTNAGEKPLVEYVELYHRSLRLAHAIARQHDPHAKVFVSLTHHWAKTVNPRFYPGRDVLETLLKFSQAEGDFDWALAYHPYPQDLGNPRTWEDRTATFSFDSPRITFRNLEVLDAWIKQPRTFYNGQHRRTVHLTEQGLNSRDYSKQALAEQAAGMAYAWQKLQGLDSIEMFHYHNWADHRAEGGLKIGLRKYPDDADDPYGKKPIWHVYRALGTADEAAAMEFAKPIVGVQEWAEIRHAGEIE
jgi:hypothetical protein